jgi:diguanylate cyclase (GGDEF)-like protein/PAS domain S-box-containing protein
MNNEATANYAEKIMLADALTAVYENIAESVSDHLFFFNEALNIDYVPESTLASAGLTLAEIHGRPVTELLSALNFPHSTDVVTETLNKGTHTGQFDPLLIDKNGHRRWFEFRVTPVTAKNGQRIYHGIASDITDKRETSYIKTHDALTGLYNRQFYEAKLKELDKEENLPLTVLVLHANNLRLVNEISGYLTGNKMLVNLARIVDENKPLNSFACRLGDEIAVIMPKATGEVARNYQNKVLEMVRQSEHSDGLICVSAGYSGKTKVTDNIDTITLKAEKHAEKQENKNRLALVKQTVDSILRKISTPESCEVEKAALVAQLCQDFAKVLHIKGPEVTNIVAAAYLHNVGKITDPNPESKEYVKRSYEIVKTIHRGSPVAEIILSHNERWDGTGYPYRKKGKAIPHGARLFAVCKKFIDISFNCELVYPEKKAIKELKLCAGKELDPAMTDIFVNAFNTNKLFLKNTKRVETTQNV